MIYYIYHGHTHTDRHHVLEPALTCHEANSITMPADIAAKW